MDEITNWNPTCELCGDRVLPTEQVYREVIGYEQHRAQGGTNALRLRKLTGRLAHRECVARASRSVAPGQESLL